MSNYYHTSDVAMQLIIKVFQSLILVEFMTLFLCIGDCLFLMLAILGFVRGKLLLLLGLLSECVCLIPRYASSRIELV